MQCDSLCYNERFDLNTCKVVPLFWVEVTSTTVAPPIKKYGERKDHREFPRVPN